MNSNQGVNDVKVWALTLLMLAFMPMSYAEYDASGVDLMERYPYGYCSSAQARGDFVYSANGTVFQVLDIHTLLPVGQVITESIVSSISVAGDYAYLANWSDGFKVIDISIPTAPTLSAQLDFVGQCWDLSVSGDYAYLGNGDDGLQIINISNPLAPVLSSTFLPTEIPVFERPTIIDNIAYAATQQGLYIIDISDPTVPLQLGYAPSENGAWSVAVVDTIAYLPKGAEGIRIVNVTDPSNPIELGYFQTPDQASWVEVIGTLAYVAERWSGIQILDISDLTAPDSVGMVELEYADGLNIQGDSLYVASSSWGLKQLNISDPLAPILLNENPGGGYVLDIYATNTHSYAAMRGLGVGVFAHGEDDEPEMIALLEIDNPKSLDGSGDLLYVIEDPNIHIVDVSDPANPQIVSTWYEGAALTSCVVGDLLFVGGNPDIQILDISDPSNPVLVGILDGLPWVPFDIKVEGRFAYVVNRGGGFWIVDIGDPTAPETLGGLEIFDYVWRLDISGQYAYLADRYTGQVRIIDVSDPANPFETSEIGSGWLLQDVACSGRYVYGLDAWNGVRVLDCANPYDPVEVGYFNTGGYAQRLHVEDGVLNVADGGGGFYVLETAYKQAVFTVNSTGDGMDANPGDGICDDGSGDCTLRAAINESNATPGFDKIAFNVEGVGPHTIQPVTAYQSITDPVDIDGTTEPDYVDTPNIEIDGSLIEYGHGFKLHAGFTSISGLVINGFNGESEEGFSRGVSIYQGVNNTVQGCFIGTDISGTLYQGNQMGISIEDSRYNLIGGVNPEDRNVISANNASGIEIWGEDIAGRNLIQGNYIGTDFSGFADLGNEWSAITIGTSFNKIGGKFTGSGNLISGSSGNGIDLLASNSIVQGNIIGLNASGTAAIGNAGGGIYISGSDNLVGGSEPGSGNVISGNAARGIWLYEAWNNVIRGNLVGTDVSGTVALGNGVEENGIIIGSGSHHNIIGGHFENEGNVVSGNDGFGVALWNEGTEFNQILGNKIGVDITGEAPLGNAWSGVFITENVTHVEIGGLEPGFGNIIANNGTGVEVRGWNVSILSNSIYNNSVIGINLGVNDGPTPNDPLDADAGFNNYQNYPEIHLVQVDQDNVMTIDYLIDTHPDNASYPLAAQFFYSEPLEPFQGRHLLFTDTYTEADYNNGVKTIQFSPVSGYEVGFADHIVATVTDDAGNSSEFSSPFLANAHLELSGTSFMPGDSLYAISRMPFSTGLEVTLVVNVDGTPGLTSIQLFDDGEHFDLQANDNVFGNVWILPEVEERHHFVDLSVNVEGEAILFENMAHYTTVGPLTLDSLQWAVPANGFPIPGMNIAFKLGLFNEGNEATAEDLEGELICDDPWIQFMGSSTSSIPDIEPDTLQMQIGIYALTLHADSPVDRDIPFVYQVSSGGNVYWVHHFVIHVYDPLALTDGIQIPETYVLEQNYPNPFNPTTTIRYGLPETADVSLVIYDLKGRVVQSYSERGRPAGWVNFEWNGTTTSGEPVSSGVYLCRMAAGQYSETIKMLLIK